MTIGYQKPKAWRSEGYLSFVRSQNCIVCMMPVCDAHHVRFAYNSGTGLKPSDTFCIPLCQDHHREIHQKGIKTFCTKYGIDIYKELFEMARKFIEEELCK